MIKTALFSLALLSLGTPAMAQKETTPEAEALKTQLTLCLTYKGDINVLDEELVKMKVPEVYRKDTTKTCAAFLLGYMFKDQQKASN